MSKHLCDRHLCFEYPGSHVFRLQMLNFQSYQASELSKMFDLDTIPVHARIYGGIKIAIYQKKISQLKILQCGCNQEFKMRKKTDVITI